MKRNGATLHETVSPDRAISRSRLRRSGLSGRDFSTVVRGPARPTRNGNGRDRAKLMPRTPKQVRIVTFMREYHAKYGYWPLLSDIAEFIGIKKVTVYEHLKLLIGQGIVLHEKKHKSRAYSVADGIKLPASGPTRSELIGLLRECVTEIESCVPRPLKLASGREVMRGENAGLIERVKKAIEE